MKSLTVLEPPTQPNVRSLLAQNGYSAALVTLEPGEALPIERSPRGEEHLLFVVDGGVTVHGGLLNTMLGKNEAHLLPKESDCTIEAAEGRPAKLLKIDVPPRQVVDAPLYTLDPKSN